MRRYAATCLAVAMVCTAAHPATEHQRGAFALQGGTAAVDAEMAARVQSQPLEAHLDVWMTPRGRTAPVVSYDEEMTKRLHLIVVSDDLRTFLHVHPVLGTDGHFRIDQPLPRRARYAVYADAMPHGYGQQVFRFALDAGGDAVVRRDLAERGATASVDGYAVTVSSLRVRAGTATTIAVHIAKAGRPARDLHPYLGAPAHAVFLNVRDLSYVHVHPETPGAMPAMSQMGSMEMPPLAANAALPPAMDLHVTLSEPGTYKVWLQFRGGAALHVAAFVVEAS